MIFERSFLFQGPSLLILEVFIIFHMATSSTNVQGIREILLMEHQLIGSFFTTIYKVLYIPSGAGFLPSPVVLHFIYLDPGSAVDQTKNGLLACFMDSGFPTNYQWEKFGRLGLPGLIFLFCSIHGDKPASLIHQHVAVILLLSDLLICGSDSGIKHQASSNTKVSSA